MAAFEQCVSVQVLGDAWEGDELTQPAAESQAQSEAQVAKNIPCGHLAMNISVPLANAGGQRTTVSMIIVAGIVTATFITPVMPASS